MQGAPTSVSEDLSALSLATTLRAHCDKATCVQEPRMAPFPVSS